MSQQKNVNSVVRSAQILECLSMGISRISDIADKLGLSRSSAHRLLKTLESVGFVQQDPLTRRYLLGPLVARLALSPGITHENLLVCASEELARLQHVTQESVALTIRIGLGRVHLEEFPSSQRLSYKVGKGFRAALYAGAAGKILLSEMSDDEAERILASSRLVKVGPNTITDEKLLRQELEKIRSQGYATSFGEVTAGAASIAIPVRGYICAVALCVFGPHSRFSPQISDALVEMKKSAARISDRLQESRRSVPALSDSM
jgi:DNA-binding IclR family transcriptional regulator